MQNTNDAFRMIRGWAEARNLIRGSSPDKQFIKLIEEVGELAEGIAKKRIDLVMDGIGDAVVVLTILAAQHEVNIEDCIAMAYDEIKDRRGKMIDGVFVKEADLPSHQ
jgi:NTP pyrophosphatase (non-canonical NTP hydrolase)